MLRNRVAALFLSVTAIVAGVALAGVTKTDTIRSESGGPVSFDAGITLPSIQVGDVHGSTASLTLAAGTNVAAVVTPVTLKYYRVGGSVCAYGQVSIDPTAGATASIFTLTLPVARGVFTGTGGAAGSAGILGATSGMCLATNAAATVTCNYVSGGTAVELVPVHFCYAASGN
jgi:hypothetical protein